MLGYSFYKLLVTATGLSFALAISYGAIAGRRATTILLVGAGMASTAAAMPLHFQTLSMSYSNLECPWKAIKALQQAIVTSQRLGLIRQAPKLRGVYQQMGYLCATRPMWHEEEISAAGLVGD